MSNLGRLALALALTIACAVVTYAACAQDAPAPSDKQIKYSPYPKQDFPNQVFFGDTHLSRQPPPSSRMINTALWIILLPV
jgi:hypothetical protein